MAPGHDFHLQLPRHRLGFGLFLGSCRHKQASLRRAPSLGGGGAGARGEQRAAAGTRGVTDRGGRAGARCAAWCYLLLEEKGGLPVRELRPHSGEAGGGVAPMEASARAPQRWQEKQKPVDIPLSRCRPY